MYPKGKNDDLAQVYRLNRILAVYIHSRYTMSFGWSVSDLVLAAKFLKTVGEALQATGGAADVHFEDSLYLRAVAATLQKLQSTSRQAPISNETRKAAKDICTSVKSLESKLATYQPAMEIKAKGFKRLSWNSYKKVDYSVFVAKQVQRFRDRISHHLHVLQLDLDMSALSCLSSVQTGVANQQTSLQIIRSIIDIQLSALEAHLGRQSAQLADIQQKDEAELLRSVLAWLKPLMSFHTKYRSTLNETMPDSCDWIFEKQEYKDWLPAVNTSRPSFLWVTAIPGAGKTFLATEVIRRLSERHTVAYFYCEARTQQSRQTTNILCTWLWQILRKHKDALIEFLDEYSSGSEPHNESMERILRAVLQTRPNIFIVLDGLDECDPTTVREISEFLISLLGHTSVLLFSRICMYTEEVLNKVSSQYRISRLQIEDTDTASDITRFVGQELETLPALQGGEKIEVAEALQGRAQGMFLWVNLAVKQLKSGGGVDVDDYLSQIRDIPQDLDEYYGRVLHNLHVSASETSRRRSRVIFQWLVCSQRPLTVSELAIAVKLDAGKPNFLQRRKFGLEELKTAVHYRCGPLAKFIDNGPDLFVTLVHATAREFLLRYDQVNEPFKNLMVNASATHTWMARCCLAYLCYEHTRIPSMKSDRLRDITTRQLALDQVFVAHFSDYALLEYAALHWIDHSRLSDYTPELCDNLQSFCTSESSTINWLQVYLHLRGDRGLFRTSRAIGDIRLLEDIGSRLRGTQVDQSFEVWLEHLRGPSDGRFERWERFLSSGDANGYLPALHIAAFFDFENFTRLALDQGSDVNERNVQNQTPLHQAARADSVNTGQLLLRYGADVNAIGWAANTPLSWAIDVECYTTCNKPGPFRMVPILLEAGADPNLTLECYSPLHRATDMPRPDDPHLLHVVELLLQYGAVKHINGYYRHSPPISNAAAAGALNLVKLLLAHGADPDGCDRGLRSSFRYPLIAALRKWHNIEIIGALLEHGCDPNVAYSDGRTALHLCASNSDNAGDVIELLLSKGCKMNTPCADGSTPLHDAVRANNLSAIKSLLDNGSDTDIVDELRRSPIMVAAELGNFQAVQMLRKYGTATKGPDWELICSSQEKVNILRHSAERMPRNEKDVFEVYWVLLTCSTRSRSRRVSRNIIVRILEFACYWPCQTWCRNDLIEYDQDQAALDTPYILTSPLQLGNRHSIRQIAFITRSHDQGWSDYPEFHGTYEGSWTWFEVAIQKADGSWHEFGPGDQKIVTNVHGSNRLKEHCVVYGHHWPKMQCKWLDTLETGDRIAILAKARFLGWVNVVHSVRIDVSSACLIQSPRNDLGLRDI